MMDEGGAPVEFEGSCWFIEAVLAGEAGLDE
jgi:hypothetical protein